MHDRKAEFQEVDLQLSINVPTVWNSTTKPTIGLCFVFVSILTGCSSSETSSDAGKFNQQQVEDYSAMIEASYDAMEAEEERYSVEADELDVSE